jgi:drug/metabolite transporter (DMT)-like permease
LDRDRLSRRARQRRDFLSLGYALSHTTPTKTAVSITVNPIFAALVGALAIGEPIGIDLVIGLVAVFAGIWIAATDRPRLTSEASR